MIIRPAVIWLAFTIILSEALQGGHLDRLADHPGADGEHHHKKSPPRDEQYDEQELIGGKLKEAQPTGRPAKNVTAAEMTGVDTNAAGDLAAFIDALLVNAVMIVIFFYLACFLHGRYPLVFAGQVELQKQMDADAAAQGITAEKIIPFYPTKKVACCGCDWSWYYASRKVTINQVIETRGLDQAMLLQFANDSMAILTFIGIPLIFIMVPCHVFLGGFRAGDDYLSYQGMANVVDNHPWLYWAHAIVLWLIVISFNKYIFAAMRSFMNKRKVWLRHLPAPRSATILVEGIPTEYCQDKALEKFFNDIFDNETCVAQVDVVKDTSRIWLEDGKLSIKRLTQARDLQKSKLDEIAHKLTEIDEKEGTTEAKTDESKEPKQDESKEGEEKDAESSGKHFWQRGPSTPEGLKKAMAEAKEELKQIQTDLEIERQACKDVAAAEWRAPDPEKDGEASRFAKMSFGGLHDRFEVGTAEEEEEEEEEELELEEGLSEEEVQAKHAEHEEKKQKHTEEKEKAKEAKAKAAAEEDAKMVRRIIAGGKSPNLTRAFVTFTSRRDAELAKMMALTDKSDEFVIINPPPPTDVIYSDLQVDPLMETSQEMVGYAMIAGVFWSYLPVVVAVAYYSSLQTLSKYGGVFETMANDPSILPLWDGLVNSLALQMFVSFVPTFFMLIFSNFFVLKAQAFLQHKVQKWYYYFLVIFVLLVTAVGSSLMDTAKELADDPGSIFYLLASSLPTASHFYLNYVPLQWVTHAQNLLRTSQLGKFKMFSALYGADLAKNKSEPEDQDYYGLGSRSARFSFLLTLTLAFASLSPLIIILGFFNFWICRRVYGYLVVFCEIKKPDLGGLFYVTQLECIQVGMFVYIALMSGVLSQRDKTIFPGLIAGVALIYQASSLYKFKTTLRWETLCFKDLKVDDDMDGAAVDSGDTYEQTDLRKEKMEEVLASGAYVGHADHHKKATSHRLLQVAGGALDQTGASDLAESTGVAHYLEGKT